MDAKKEPPKFLPHFPQLETTGIAVMLICYMMLRQGMFSTLLPSLDRRSSSPTASSPFIGGAKHFPQIWRRTPCKYEAGVQMLLLLHDCFHLFRLDCQCLMVWTGKDLIRFRPGGECFNWSGFAVFFHLASTS